MGIQVGQTIPSATFSYIPYTPELEDGVRKVFTLQVYNCADASPVTGTTLVCVRRS